MLKRPLVWVTAHLLEAHTAADRTLSWECAQQSTDNEPTLPAQVMLDDVSESYCTLRLGKAPRLPLVRLQYPDFAAWQAGRLQSASLQRQVSPPHMPACACACLKLFMSPSERAYCDIIT